MTIARASIKRFRVVLFFCVLMAVSGIAAYFQIGKLEDPSFTIKTAVVSVVYPGATAYEVETEVVDRVEDAIQEIGEIKHIRSRCYPGLAIVYVDIKDQYMREDLPEIWDILRQKLHDVEVSMPPGSTIMVNNDYGDVYGQYYALVGDGYTMKELRDYADSLKKQLVLVPGVASVKLIGEQEEAIYVEFSTSRLTSLGLSPQAVFSVLNQQNELSAIGSTTQGSRYVRVSPTSAITSVDDIGNIVIGGTGERLIRLREVATVRRDYIDPQSFEMRFNGRPALGLGVATVDGGNVVKMGEAVTARLKQLEVQRPIGIEMYEIYMQSDQVIKSVNDFIINLIESLAIVVGVLLIFMGLRTGLLIGVVLLLTIAGTFTIMNYTGVFLQTVSLGALIVALGSLVDNAIVVSEGMLVGVERGMMLEDAANQSVEESKWAMLGGTVIAIMAFTPIGLSQDSSGEYCRSLLQVVAISMMLSWVMALTATPVLGKALIKPHKADADKDPYSKGLFRAYRALLESCLRHRVLALGVTAAMFVFAIWLGATRLDTTFFPESRTSYFTVELWNEEGTSLAKQRATTIEFEEYLRTLPEVKNISAFIGGGSLRFMLTYQPPDSNISLSQLLVEVNDIDMNLPTLLKVQEYLNTNMPGVTNKCKLFSRGSGITPKIEARFYGDDPAVLRELAARAEAIMKADPSHDFVRNDWREPVEVLHPVIMKDQLRNLGLTRPDVTNAILSATTGQPVGAYRDGDRSLKILAALIPDERNRMDKLKSFPVWAPTAGAMVPLSTVISGIGLAYEDNIIMRRDRSRMITVASEVKQLHNADRMLARIMPQIEAIELPVDYWLEWGGEYEVSHDAMAGMQSAFAPALLIMFAIMVFLFNGFRPAVIIFGALPLILIGVIPGLCFANKSLSFLAIVGVLSLVGMLAKNSIVLLDQVSADFEAGRDRYTAIVEDAVSRLRPVAMSALTTVLGMVPLVPDTLFGPMAVSIMVGLTVSSILTLLVIPVATAILYKVPCPAKQ